MTILKSNVKLGIKYTDERTGVEGHASALYFNEHGCVEVNLEFPKDGKLENVVVNELRLTTEDKDARGTVYEHESDIILGHKYEDIQTGIKGHACTIDIQDLQTNRVTIRTTTTSADGSKKLIYYSIDEFLLKDLDTNKVPKRKKDDKPSPITREVERR